MFADGCPGGGIGFQGGYINNAVIQKNISVTAVADNVDGIVFDSTLVKVFIDLIKNITFIVKHKDFSSFCKAVNDHLGVFNCVTDDHQFVAGAIGDS